MRFSRLHHIVLFVVLVFAAVISSSFSRSSASPKRRQSESQTQIQNPNRKVVLKAPWRNPPYEVSRVKVKKGFIQFAEKFDDDRDDWLEGLSFTIKSTSTKPILVIEAAIYLFDREDKLPGRVGCTFNFQRGSEQESSNDFNPIQPGESVQMELEDYSALTEFLISNAYPVRFRTVELGIDRVVFADNTMWYKGYNFVRDPTQHSGWKRDR